MDAAATSTLCYSASVHRTVNHIFSPGILKTPCFWVSTPAPSPIRFPPKRLNFPPTTRFQNGFVAWSAAPTSPDHSSSDPIGVLLDVDGVLVDAYKSGNRQVFNVAFRKLGLDCANWTEPIYSDLLRRGNGYEERMLALYFNRVGWPTSLPTNEKDSFLKSVLQEKEKALADFLMSSYTPLRPGVEKFIDDACNEGIRVGVLAASCRFGEETARGIVKKLGPGRMSKLMVIGKAEMENSFYRQLECGLEKFSGLGDDLANEASKAAAAEKKRIAEEVASILKLRVDMNTSSAESVRDIVFALQAAAENADVPVHNCVLIAGSQLAVAASDTIGMPCIFLRSGRTSREELASAVSVMDGFGNPYLTVSLVRSMLSTSSGKAS